MQLRCNDGTVTVIDVQAQAGTEEETQMAATRDARSSQQLAAAVAVAAVVVNDHGRLLEATCGAASMLGYERSDLLGRELHELAAEGWTWGVQDALLRLLRVLWMRSICCRAAAAGAVRWCK